MVETPENMWSFVSEVLRNRFEKKLILNDDSAWWSEFKYQVENFERHLKAKSVYGVGDKNPIHKELVKLSPNLVKYFDVFQSFVNEEFLKIVAVEIFNQIIKELCEDVPFTIDTITYYNQQNKTP